MIQLFLIIPLAPLLLWLLAIRPYCIRHGKGYTPGANIEVTFWVDWQEARETSRENGHGGMVIICRIVFWLKALLFLLTFPAILVGLFPG